MLFHVLFIILKSCGKTKRSYCVSVPSVAVENSIQQVDRVLNMGLSEGPCYSVQQCGIKDVCF